MEQRLGSQNKPQENTQLFLPTLSSVKATGNTSNTTTTQRYRPSTNSYSTAHKNNCFLPLDEKV